MNVTSIQQPFRWDISVVQGDWLQALSIRIKDFDGNNFADYVPSMPIRLREGVEPAKTLTISDGLTKDGAVTMLDVATGLPPLQYKHSFRIVTTSGRQFTPFTGNFVVTRAEAAAGGVSGLKEQEYRLPTRIVEGVGNVLLDHLGNPILDSQGNPILF